MGMMFIWKRLRSVRYIDFDKTKETKYTTEKVMIDTIRLHKNLLSEFKESVISYLKGGFPIIVDFTEGTIEKVTSDIIIDDGTKNKEDNSISHQLEKYMKNVSRTYNGSRIE